MQLESKIKVLNEMIDILPKIRYICNAFSNIVIKSKDDDIRQLRATEVRIRKHMYVLFPELYDMIMKHGQELYDKTFRYHVTYNIGDPWLKVATILYKQDKLRELIKELEQTK